MADLSPIEASQQTLVEIPVSVEGSPYQFKLNDPYSSHSVILSLLPERGSGRVLDVGAAHGYLGAELEKRGFRVTGIEGDPTLARSAAERCSEVFHADLDGPLPELSGSFDYILYGDVLEHLKDPLRVLRSFNRLLQPGGVVIISAPNVANISIRLQLLMGRFEPAERGILDRTHLYFYTRKSFLRLIDDAGLQVTSLSATPIPLPLVVPEKWQGRIFSAIHRFSAWMARARPTLFGYQFVAVTHARRFA
jgi:2-polyprenyl-3-methyl-5-hydroxy-6-metoxy-1,4-benzoquinol methylase